MEGNRSLMAVNPGEILWKIRGLTRSIVRDLSVGRWPTISIDRFRNYRTNSNLICSCKPDFHEGKSTPTLGRACHARRIDLSVVDRAIDDLCILLNCSCHNLNVVSVGKGLVMGWLRFTEAESWYDCMNILNAAHPVPVHVEKVDGIKNDSVVSGDFARPI